MPIHSIAPRISNQFPRSIANHKEPEIPGCRLERNTSRDSFQTDHPLHPSSRHFNPYSRRLADLRIPWATLLFLGSVHASLPLPPSSRLHPLRSSSSSDHLCYLPYNCVSKIYDLGIEQREIGRVSRGAFDIDRIKQPRQYCSWSLFGRRVV